MTLIQPILALAIAVLCALITGLPPDQKRLSFPRLWAVAAYVIFLAASTFCAIKLGGIDDRRAVIASMAAGALVSLAAVTLSRLSVGVSIALATAGACVAHLVRADAFPEVSLVYAYSVAMGAVFFGAFPGAVAAGLAGGLITMADYLGRAGEDTPNRAMIGVILGLALSIVAVLLLSAKRVIPNGLGKMEACGVVLLAAGAGFAVSKWSLGGPLWILLGTASVAGLVVHWLVPSEEGGTALRVGVASAIWLALCTIGFSIMGGFGMGIALLQGAMILLLLGNGRAVLTLGPALGLVIYRVMRNASPDTSRAIDLGQHYGVTGVVVGSVIPVIYADWFFGTRSKRSLSEAVASLLWGFILICLPALSIVVLGAKGASGVVVGLGLSGFLLAYRKIGDSPIIAVILAAGAANAVAVDWIGEALDFTRQEKLHSFGWWALAMAIAAGGILVVSRVGKHEAAS